LPLDENRCPTPVRTAPAQLVEKGVRKQCYAGVDAAPVSSPLMLRKNIPPLTTRIQIPIAAWVKRRIEKIPRIPARMPSQPA